MYILVYLQKEAKEARENREIYRSNLVAAYSKYLDPTEDNIMEDSDIFLKYYFFITRGAEADTKYLTPIDPRTVNGIIGRLSKEFQKSPFLPEFKNEILNVNL